MKTTTKQGRILLLINLVPEYLHYHFLKIEKLINLVQESIAIINDIGQKMRSGYKEILTDFRLLHYFDKERDNISFFSYLLVFLTIQSEFS